MDYEQEIYFRLAAALTIGLLIGTERGWKARDSEEGARVAGVRTFGLIGLVGGVVGLLSAENGALLLGLGFLAMAGVLSAVYVANLERDAGITTLTAGLLTFSLGALAARGEVAAAAASAVVTTLLLGYKPVLHNWLRKVEEKELRAGIKLLLISVVLLPVLPNRGFGPLNSINPYAIWWMVVLIAGISFIGYFALKLGGPRRGVAFTGLFGGLASSTAVTLHLSRSARKDEALAPILGTGILIACASMIPRILVLGAMLNPPLLKSMLLPALVMAVPILLPALWQLRRQSDHPRTSDSLLRNPLELGTALGFGVLLALVMFLAKALQAQFGDTGVLALAAASGITDVDAITLSIARMSRAELAEPTAVIAIFIAAASNTLAKAGLAVFVGGRAVASRVGMPLLVSVLATISTLALLYG